MRRLQCNKRRSLNVSTHKVLVRDQVSNYGYQFFSNVAFLVYLKAKYSGTCDSMLHLCNTPSPHGQIMALKSLVTIVGTTGVGKSRLAVDLALSMLNNGLEHGFQAAKVINSDAMQAYNGADVITNKMPLQERKGVDHLLIGFKQPGEQYVVGQWVNDAIREVSDNSKHH